MNTSEWNSSIPSTLLNNSNCLPSNRPYLITWENLRLLRLSSQSINNVLQFKISKELNLNSFHIRSIFQFREMLLLVTVQRSNNSGRRQGALGPNPSFAWSVVRERNKIEIRENSRTHRSPLQLTQPIMVKIKFVLENGKDNPQNRRN